MILYIHTIIRSVTGIIVPFQNLKVGLIIIAVFFKSLRTGSDSISKKAVQILAEFAVKLNRVYGFEREEGLEYVLDYFIDKRWTYVHWKN